MKQLLKSKMLLALLSLFLLTDNNYGVQCNKEGEKGNKIHNKEYFTFFSIILQDTSLERNLFTSNHLKHISINGKILHDQRIIANEYLTPVILDTSYVYKIENFVKSKTKKKYRKIKKYIRLYMGCIDLDGDTCVVVQYLSIFKYIFNSDFYSRGFCFDPFSCSMPNYYGFFKIENDSVIFLQSYLPVLGEIKPEYPDSFIKMIKEQDINQMFIERAKQDTITPPAPASVPQDTCGNNNKR